METIYYRTKDGYVPASAFLSRRYGISNNDDKKTQVNKSKKFAKVRIIIKIATENGGIAGGSFSSSLIGYSFQELRIQEGNRLVRILYFAYHKEKLVLLNAYDKPNLYEKNGKKKVEKEIEVIHKQTQEYYEDFLKNPNRYEKYEL